MVRFLFETFRVRGPCVEKVRVKQCAVALVAYLNTPSRQILFDDLHKFERIGEFVEVLDES